MDSFEISRNINIFSQWTDCGCSEIQFLLSFWKFHNLRNNLKSHVSIDAREWQNCGLQSIRNSMNNSDKARNRSKELGVPMEIWKIKI